MVAVWTPGFLSPCGGGFGSTVLAEAAPGMPRPLGKSQGTWSCGKEEGDVRPRLGQRPAWLPQLGEKDCREREGGGGGRP